MKKVLKLFVLRDSSGAVINDETNYGSPLYFQTKTAAKLARNQLKTEGITVSAGPDHHKYRGEKL